jgi:hypothetical protein
LGDTDTILKLEEGRHGDTDKVEINTADIHFFVHTDTDANNLNFFGIKFFKISLVL